MSINEKTTIRVFVYSLNGDGCGIDMDPNKTIQCLIDEAINCQQLKHFSQQRCVLIHENGKELDESSTLLQCEVGESSVLTLIVDPTVPNLQLEIIPNLTYMTLAYDHRYRDIYSTKSHDFLETGKEFANFQFHSLSPNIISILYNHRLMVYSLDPCHRIEIKKKVDNIIKSSMSPNGAYMACLSSGPTTYKKILSIFNTLSKRVEEWDIMKTLTIDNVRNVTNIVFSADSKMIAIQENHFVHIIHIPTEKKFTTTRYVYTDPCVDATGFLASEQIEHNESLSVVRNELYTWYPSFDENEAIQNFCLAFEETLPIESVLSRDNHRLTIRTAKNNVISYVAEDDDGIYIVDKSKSFAGYNSIGVSSDRHTVLALTGSKLLISASSHLKWIEINIPSYVVLPENVYDEVREIAYYDSYRDYETDENGGTYEESYDVPVYKYRKVLQSPSFIPFQRLYMSQRYVVCQNGPRTFQFFVIKDSEEQKEREDFLVTMKDNAEEEHRKQLASYQTTHAKIVEERTRERVEGVSTIQNSELRDTYFSFSLSTFLQSIKKKFPLPIAKLDMYFIPVILADGRINPVTLHPVTKHQLPQSAVIVLIKLKRMSQIHTLYINQTLSYENYCTALSEAIGSHDIGTIKLVRLNYGPTFFSPKQLKPLDYANQTKQRILSLPHVSQKSLKIWKPYAVCVSGIVEEIKASRQETCTAFLDSASTQRSRKTFRSCMEECATRFFNEVTQVHLFDAPIPRYNCIECSFENHSVVIGFTLFDFPTNIPDNDIKVSLSFTFSECEPFPQSIEEFLNLISKIHDSNKLIAFIHILRINKVNNLFHNEQHLISNEVEKKKPRNVFDFVNRYSSSQFGTSFHDLEVKAMKKFKRAVSEYS